MFILTIQRWRANRSLQFVGIIYGEKLYLLGKTTKRQFGLDMCDRV